MATSRREGVTNPVRKPPIWHSRRISVGRGVSALIWLVMNDDKSSTTFVCDPVPQDKPAPLRFVLVRSRDHCELEALGAREGSTPSMIRSSLMPGGDLLGGVYDVEWLSLPTG